MPAQCQIFSPYDQGEKENSTLPSGAQEHLEHPMILSGPCSGEILMTFNLQACIILPAATPPEVHGRQDSEKLGCFGSLSPSKKQSKIPSHGYDAEAREFLWTRMSALPNRTTMPPGQGHLRPAGTQSAGTSVN